MDIAAILGKLASLAPLVAQVAKTLSDIFDDSETSLPETHAQVADQFKESFDILIPIVEKEIARRKAIAESEGGIPTGNET
jgi:hypothetical protein